MSYGHPQAVVTPGEREGRERALPTVIELAPSYAVSCSWQATSDD